MSRWFRFYAEAMRHPKVAKLSDRDFRFWMQLLSVASENNGTIPPVGDLKVVLKARLDHLLEGLKRLISAGLIDVQDGSYEPHDWSKHQYKSDTSTTRVTLHRQRRNVSETAPEADTETEQKKETDTNVSGDGTPPPVRKLLWADGVESVRRQTGFPLAKAKSLVGRWLKMAKDDAAKVLTYIRQAEADGRDLVPWVEAIFAKSQRPPGLGLFG